MFWISHHMHKLWNIDPVIFNFLCFHSILPLDSLFKWIKESHGKGCYDIWYTHPVHPSPNNKREADSSAGSPDSKRTRITPRKRPSKAPAQVSIPASLLPLLFTHTFIRHLVLQLFPRSHHGTGLQLAQLYGEWFLIPLDSLLARNKANRFFKRRGDGASPQPPAILNRAWQVVPNTGGRS